MLLQARLGEGHLRCSRLHRKRRTAVKGSARIQHRTRFVGANRAALVREFPGFAGKELVLFRKARLDLQLDGAMEALGKAGDLDLLDGLHMAFTALTQAFLWRR